jgi:hypothetical protein
MAENASIPLRFTNGGAMTRSLMVCCLAVGMGFAACSDDKSGSNGDGGSGSGGSGGSGGGGSGGGSGAGAPDYACDIVLGPSHSCYSYAWGTAIPAATQQTYKDQCTASMGTVVASCSTANLLGVCTYTAGAQTATQWVWKLHYYKQTGLTEALIMKTCTQANQPNLMTSWQSGG